MIQKLDEEDYRSRKFLDASSYAKVTKECETRLVSDHISFLHGECREIVKKEKRGGKCPKRGRRDRKHLGPACSCFVRNKPKKRYSRSIQVGFCTICT